MTGVERLSFRDSREVRTRRFLRQSKVGVLVALAAFLLAALAQYASVLQKSELWLYDALIRVRVRDASHFRSPVTLVLINPRDLKPDQVNAGNITDDALADLLQRILDDHPAVIGLDVFRAEPIAASAEKRSTGETPDKPPTGGTPDKLKDVILRNRQVILSEFLGLPDGAPIPVRDTIRDFFRTPEARIGFADYQKDDRSTVRRAFMNLRVERRQKDARSQEDAFSLAFLVARAYLASRPSKVSIVPNDDDYLIGPAKTSLKKLSPDAGGYSGLDAGGFQFLIDYRDQNFTKCYFSDVHCPSFADKVVLVGYYDEHDSFGSPLRGDPNLNGNIPGVELHGHVVSQLIRMGEGQTAPVRPAPPALTYFCILVFALGASVYGTLARSYAWFGAGLSLNLLAVLLSAGIALEIGNLWVPAVPSLLAAFLSANLAKVAARRWLRIFVNYAREDAERVREVYACLRAAGQHPWVDTENLDRDAGALFSEAIASQIRRSDRFLACISEASLVKTENPSAVAGEIMRNTVLAKEIVQALDTWDQKLDGKKGLIPVRLEPCRMPERLKEVQCIDFYGDDCCSRLLAALRA